MKKRIAPLVAAAAALGAFGTQASVGPTDYALAKASSRTRAEVLGAYVVARGNSSGPDRTATYVSTRMRGAVLADYDVARPAAVGGTLGTIEHGGLTPARVASEDARGGPLHAAPRTRSPASEGAGG